MAESRVLFDRFVDHVFMEPTPEEAQLGTPTSQQASWQRMLCGELQKWKSYPMGDPRRRDHSVLVLVSRGWGKSTWICVYYPTWRIGTNRNLRHIITSSAEAQAKIFMRAIENVLLNRPRYRELFGNLVPDARTLTWTDTEKIVLDRNAMIKDASFYAFGVGGATINRRADIILADDIVDKENSSTLLQREKLKSWFWESVVPILEPGGQLVVSGTRYHSKELYEDLIRLWQDNYSPSDDALVDTARFDRRPCHNPEMHRG
jgi:hypothetical protein